MQLISLKNYLDGIVRPDNGSYGNVRVYTASYTILELGDAGDVFSNTGATGAVTFTLPTPKNGRVFTFLKKTQQDVVIQATKGAKIYGPGGTSAANGTLTNSAAESGKMVELFADGTDWLCAGNYGTWTAA